jgi:hypothetical protein
MTQSSMAARSRWRAHRLAHHDPNDPKLDALRAHRLACSMAGGLAGWRAGGLAGWLAPRKKRWGGRADRPAKKML